MEFIFNTPENAEPQIVEETKLEAPVVSEPAVEEVVVEDKPKKVAKTGLVAIKSTKKVTWDGVGSLEIGINHVTPEDAEKWIKAKYFVTAAEETAK